MAMSVRLAALATAGAIVTITPTLAGGFQRGTADTDILYDPGTVAIRTSYIYVDPRRNFTSVEGRGGAFEDYTGDYTIPSLAFYVGGDPFGCAGTYTESFAAEADYSGTLDGALPSQVSSTLSTSNTDRLDFAGATSTSRTVRMDFSTNEFGVTCRASMTNAYGRFSLLGGIFFEDFDFDGKSIGLRDVNASFAGTPLAAGLAASGSSIILPTVVDVDSRGGYKPGYRIGVAYEKPEIALRLQALYRSEVVHDDVVGTGTATITDTAYVSLPDGTTASIPTVFGPAGATVLKALPGAEEALPVDSALNDATAPASLYLNGQMGIAPGTLLLASFRWTDWSTNEAVVSSVTSASGTTSSFAPYHWRDGYTVSLGVGHAFNEAIAGAIAVGYDRGVSTGAETTYTDFYSLSGGLSFRGNAWSEMRVGGLIGYWAGGSQSVDDGGYFDATVGGDVVFGLNASIKMTF